MTRTQSDILLAWIDTNGVYYGTWDTTSNGTAIRNWGKMREDLVAEMEAVGCMRCHAYFEEDWINLDTPEHSRVLRAPLVKGKDGFGLAWCRERNVDPSRKRIHLLRHGYRHAVQSLGSFPRRGFTPADRSGEPVVTFASTADPHYRAMLDIIRAGRKEVLAAPRVDMPGARINSGTCRLFLPPGLPESLPSLRARVDDDGAVRLSWSRSAKTIGLSAEVHRGATRDFLPDQDTLLATTMLFEYSDTDAPPGSQHYAVILRSDSARGEPIRTEVEVPSRAGQTRAANGE